MSFFSGAKKPEEKEEEKHTYGSLVDQREAERIEHLTLALSEQSPPWAAKYIQKAAWPVGVIVSGGEVVLPKVINLCVGAYNVYEALPKRAAGALCGMGICFFGGRYAVSLAAIQAFKSTGGSQMVVWMKDLHHECVKVWQANKKDEDQGEVENMTTAQLSKHKFLLVLKTVNPEKLTTALNGLWTGYMGVLATLRFQFAKTVALAHSISETIRPIAGKFFAPTIIALTPPDYRQWVNPVIKYSCQYIAIKIAWKIQEIISSVNAGLSGGHMVTDNLLALAQEHNHLTWIGAGHFTTDVLATALAGCGIYFQIVKGGYPPFPFGILMWPLDFLERFLQWQVTYMIKDDPATSK